MFSLFTKLQVGSTDGLIVLSRQIHDLMEEAGFRSSEVYWEGADEDGDGNGIFRKVRKVENEDSWIAYLVGWR